MVARALLAMVFCAACTFDPSGLAATSDADQGPPDAPAPAVDTSQPAVDAAPLLPDASAPDANLPDASFMCVDDSCNGCGFLQTCTACCLGDCATSSCSGGCSCTFDCTSPSGACRPTCSGLGTNCAVDCSGLVAHSCTPACDGGAGCSIDCGGASQCEPTCTGSLCNIDCVDAETCENVDCLAGSVCTVQCGGSLAPDKCKIRVCENFANQSVNVVTCCHSDGTVATRQCNVLLGCPWPTSTSNCL